MQNLKVQIKEGDKTVHLKQSGLLPGKDYICVDVVGRGQGKEYIILNPAGRLIEVPEDKLLVMGVWPETVEISGMEAFAKTLIDGITEAYRMGMGLGKGHQSKITEDDFTGVSDLMKGSAKTPAKPKPKTTKK